MQNLWYKNAIIYALDVDRFMDADGDGIGDFAGLTEKIDYLADLGITCLWLLPFYPAPDRDNGYDIKNYYDVDPALGTLGEFIRFVQRAGERGIRVVIDLVMNHTSDQHPWFQAARYDADSQYRNYYTWSDAPPPTPPDKGPIFPGQEQTVWTYDEVAGAYYYHRFYHFQPDLEMKNPEVRRELQRVLDFWLSFGVSGFRIDAAPHMIGVTETSISTVPDPHGLLKEIHTFVKKRLAGAVLVGEADVEPEHLADFFGDEDELTLLFNFMLNNYLFLALAREEAEPIRGVLRQLPAIPQSCQWANFWRNLDEVDLERLTDDERQDVFDQFAPKEDMRIFGRGIRRRLAPMFEGDRRRLELGYSLLFSLPGTPTIIYGDEIGMGEDLDQEGRNAVRTPMQWSDARNAGFSSAPKSALLQPVVESGTFSYKKVNVAAQQEDQHSFLHWMKRLIQVRRECPEIGYGTWHSGTDEPGVLAQRNAWKDGLIITLHNLTNNEQIVALNLRDQQGRRLTNLLSDGAEPIEDGNFETTLEPYGYRWYRVEGERIDS